MWEIAQYCFVKDKQDLASETKKMPRGNRIFRVLPYFTALTRRPTYTIKILFTLGNNMSIYNKHCDVKRFTKHFLQILNFLFEIAVFCLGFCIVDKTSKAGSSLEGEFSANWRLVCIRKPSEQSKPIQAKRPTFCRPLMGSFYQNLQENCTAKMITVTLL